MRAARALLVVAWLAAGLPWAGTPRARACNACLEDKIAATYDWQVVSTARRRNHQVVFVAIEGKVAPRDSALARTVVRGISAVKGVDAGTVRVSLAPPAASFACDPTRDSPQRLIAVMNHALRRSQLKLAIVSLGIPGATNHAAR